MRAFIFLSCIYCLLLLIIGCTTAKKAVAYMDKHEEVAAPYCAVRYPVKDTTIIRDSLVTDTVEISEPAYIFDTIYVEGKPVILNRKCPPSKVVTQTQIRTIEKQVENTAKTKVLELQLNDRDIQIGLLKDRLAKAQQETADAKSAKRQWFWYFWILVAIIGVIVGVRIKGRLPFL